MVTPRRKWYRKLWNRKCRTLPYGFQGDWRAAGKRSSTCGAGSISLQVPLAAALSYRAPTSELLWWCRQRRSWRPSTPSSCNQFRIYPSETTMNLDQLNYQFWILSRENPSRIGFFYLRKNFFFFYKKQFLNRVLRILDTAALNGPVDHDGDAITEEIGLFHEVGGHQDRPADPLLSQKIPHVPTWWRIHPRCRFVQQHHLPFMFRFNTDLISMVTRMKVNRP